jgi:hypothetical protein
MKGLDVGYGVLVTGLTSAGAGSINNSTGVDGVVGVKSCCAKRKRNFSQLLLPWPAVIRSSQNHIGWFVQTRSPRNPATKIMTTTTPMM